jgi:hypothetical protein
MLSSYTISYFISVFLYINVFCRKTLCRFGKCNIFIRKHLFYNGNFVIIRNAPAIHAPLVQHIERLEEFKNRADTRIDLLFKVLEEKSPIPETGIFFEGEVFDVWVFVSDLIRSAKHSVLLIDNYIDDTILKLFTKRAEGGYRDDCTTLRLTLRLHDFTTARKNEGTIRRLDD